MTSPTSLPARTLRRRSSKCLQKTLLDVLTRYDDETGRVLGERLGEGYNHRRPSSLFPAGDGEEQVSSLFMFTCVKAGGVRAVLYMGHASFFLGWDGKHRVNELTPKSNVPRSILCYIDISYAYL